MKQGKRVANVIGSRIQIVDCEVFSVIVFRVNSVNKVFGIRLLVLLYE